MKRAKGWFEMSKPEVRGADGKYIIWATVRVPGQEFDYFETVAVKRMHRADLRAFRGRAYDAFCYALLGTRP